MQAAHGLPPRGLPLHPGKPRNDLIRAASWPAVSAVWSRWKNRCAKAIKAMRCCSQCGVTFCGGRRGSYTLVAAPEDGTPLYGVANAFIHASPMMGDAPIAKHPSRTDYIAFLPPHYVQNLLPVDPATLNLVSMLDVTLDITWR
jgi:hypothetical protein